MRGFILPMINYLGTITSSGTTESSYALLVFKFQIMLSIKLDGHFNELQPRNCCHACNQPGQNGLTQSFLVLRLLKYLDMLCFIQLVYWPVSFC